MKRAKNLIKLFSGLVAGNFRYSLSGITWEFLQTIIGFLSAVFFLLWFGGAKVGFFEGVTVICAYGKKRQYWGGVCFGRIIIGDKRINVNALGDLIAHEFGHTIQSRISGPLFFFKYGLPSFFDLQIRGSGHNKDWSEQDANVRAKKFFELNYPHFKWPEKNHPVHPNGRTYSPRWWEFIPGVFPIIVVFVNYFRGRIK